LATTCGNSAAAMKIIQSTVGKGLRAARTARGLPQEEFTPVTGRTYISDVERGAKNPTVVKVDQLAAVMRLHPLTVLTLSYCKTPSTREAAVLLARVSAELEELMAGAKD
jgi:transcriptional regulator with XRE-family HTH domain